MIIKYLFLFLTIQAATAQVNNKLIVNYEAKSILKVEDLSPEIRSNTIQMKYIYELQKKYEEIEYILKIDKQKSSFETVKKLSIDASNYVANLENKVRYYVDDEIFIEQKESLGQEFLITEDTNKQNWEVRSRKKNILGFECFNATLKKSDDLFIEAWFTPQINHSFGPKGYHGLPGLILELIQNNKIAYTATSINEDSELYVFKPSTGKAVNRLNYNKIINSSISNFQEEMKNN